MIKTPVQPTPEAKKFFNDAAETMGYLWERRQDEKQYEDIKDYAKPLEGLAKECGVTILKMTKQPFGCEFSVGPRQFRLEHTAKHYSYKRIS